MHWHVLILSDEVGPLSLNNRWPVGVFPRCERLVVRGAGGHPVGDDIE